jgi:hypothetical protein
MISRLLVLCLQVDAPAKPCIQVHLELCHVVPHRAQRVFQRPNLLLHLGRGHLDHLKRFCRLDLEESIADLVRHLVVLVDQLQLGANVIQLLLGLVLRLKLFLQVQLALVQPAELVDLLLVLAADLNLGARGLLIFSAELEMLVLGNGRRDEECARVRKTDHSPLHGELW